MMRPSAPARRPALEKPPKLKIRKGDLVEVMAGKDRGKQGKVLQLVRARARVVVEQVNLLKKHMKQTREAKGGIVEKASPLSLANVMFRCPRCARPVRLGIRRLEDGQRRRYCKRCGEVVDHE